MSNSQVTNKKLKETVLSVIEHPGVWKINFELNGLVVTGRRYSMVARAIREGKIFCNSVAEFKSVPGVELAAGMVTTARYKEVQNTMLFRGEDYGKTNIERATIFHEATHALFDLFANTTEDRVLGIDDESAAVLAEALYHRLCGVGSSIGYGMTMNGHEQLALELADKMMAETGDFEKDRRTYFLKPYQIEKFRMAVARSWNMVKKVLPDGTVNDSSGQLSIYDGVVPCYSCWVHKK